MGESELAIPEDAKFKREIEGEGLIEFSAKDLFNAFATRKRIDREFSKLDREKKQFERERNLTAAEKEQIKREKAELQFINNGLSLMVDRINEKDVIGALEVASQMARRGEYSEAQVQELMQESVKLAEKIQNMTPEEEELFWKERSLTRKEREIKAREAKEAEAQGYSQLDEYVNTAKSRFKISDDELTAAYNELQRFDALLEENGQTPKLKGKNGFQVTDLCANWVLGAKFKGRVESAVSAISPDKAKDQKLIAELINLVDPKWSDSDISDIVRGYLEDEVKPTSKDSEVAAKPAATPRAPSEVEKKQGAVLSYRDLMKLYQ